MTIQKKTRWRRSQHVESYASSATETCNGSFGAANVSFNNASQVLEVSTARYSMTPLLVGYGLETADPFDLSHASRYQTLHRRLDRTRLRVALANLLGARAKSVRSVLKDISSEIADYIQGTGSVLVVIDSVTDSALSPSQRRSWLTSTMLWPVSSILVEVHEAIAVS